MKSLSYCLAAIMIMSLTACAAVSSTPWGKDCPEPETDGNGILKIQDGKTLKCQIQVFTSNMGCSERFTNANGDDGLACTSGNKGVVFFFDSNGVLKEHHFTQR